MSHRRSSSDTRWQQTKATVEERDRSDRILKVLTVSEMYELRRNAKQLLQVLDPAHVIPVSKAGWMCYDEDNVILLNRFSHENLDLNRCPITGRNITQNRVHRWWARIVGINKYKELLTRAHRRLKNEQ